VPTLVTTHALVLSRRPWSESSQVVTLLTPDLGKLRAVARGVRRLKSEVGPALEPITESEVVLSQSPRSDLAQIRSAEVEEFYSGLKRSLVRVALAGALCELADRAMPEEEANLPLYEHVRTALRGIERSDDRPAVNWLWWAALQLAADLGYAMQFGACVRCGSTELPHPEFSAAEGGPVCANCRAADRRATDCRAWFPETQRTLLRLAEVSAEELVSHRIPKQINREIRALLEEFFRFHIPGFDRLKSLDILTTSAEPSLRPESPASPG